MRSTSVVDGNGPGGSSARVALLTLELMLAPGSSSAIAYSMPLESIHSRFMALYDRALTKLQVGDACGRHLASIWHVLKYTCALCV